MGLIGKIVSFFGRKTKGTGGGKTGGKTSKRMATGGGKGSGSRSGNIFKRGSVGGKSYKK